MSAGLSVSGITAEKAHALRVVWYDLMPEKSHRAVDVPGAPCAPLVPDVPLVPEVPDVPADPEPPVPDPPPITESASISIFASSCLRIFMR